MAVKRRRSFHTASAVLGCAALLAGTGPALAETGGTQRGFTWRTAIEIPGTAALNTGGDAVMAQVSCSSPGNCGAGGFYTDRSRHRQAFVVTERAGRWGRAIEVPGTAALNTGGDAEIRSVSCPSPGNCAADGTYLERSLITGLFVVTERAGRWGRAITVPGLAGLSVERGADMGPVSCPSAGSCVAGGDYRDNRGRLQAFVVSETDGSWGAAIEPSGAGLKASDYARISSVSCSSPGNCTVGGSDRPSGAIEPIVIMERRGHWAQAVGISVPASLGAITAGIETLSCGGSPDECSAGGSYQGAAINYEAFVVSATNGRWGRALEVPGTGALNTGAQAATTSMSCPSAGACVAGGYYTGSSGEQGFLVSEVGGRWRKALQVPGLAALSPHGGFSEVGGVSCPSAGNCAAVGFYTGPSGTRKQDFVVSETNGRWGQALEVPGLAALNAGQSASISSVSCPSAGHCATVGEYTDRAGHFEVFVSSES